MHGNKYCDIMLMEEEQMSLKHHTTLKTLCRPSGVGSFASTLFRSSCSAANVSLYSACIHLSADVSLRNMTAFE